MCKSVGRDSDSSHLFMMQDGVTYCCNRDDIHPTGKIYLERDGLPVTSQLNSSVTPRPLVVGGMLTNVEIEKLPNTRFIRSIKPDVVQKYGVYCTLTPSGEPDKHFYPMTVKKKVIAYKMRTPDKKFPKNKTIAGMEIDLFGVNTIKGKPEHLIITEGELDAMSTYQMLSPHYKHIAVLSLPDGAKSLTCLVRNKEVLTNCHNLYFYPDQDKPGLEVIKEIIKLHPKINIIYTSEKDANAMLTEGKAAEFMTAFKNAEKYKPKSILTVADLKVQAIKPVRMGLSYPWDDMTDLTYGAKTKRIIGIGAAPGAGKTVFVQMLEKHLVYEHGEKIAVFSLEEDPAYSLKKLIGSVMNQAIHIPGTTYDLKEAGRIADTFNNKVLFYDSNEYTDWPDIEETIRYFASEGVKYFFIDPLSALVSHLDTSDGNRYLNSAMYTMSKIVKSLDITIFHVNHLNNPKTGKDHSEGGKVTGGQFTGSKAQWRFSTDLWGLIRNQQAELEAERNLSQIMILKDRMVGNAGKSFHLNYETKSGLLVPAFTTATGF